MAAVKPKTQMLNGGAHTAGIYADLSVDGPEIGTLVAIVDRAKNLPNRKTIGKQDPYCAARLGKEAKKTSTDIRGGQTPKWDQELRFTVHDSPDYYQLKISVFTDDKRTDLIGEGWIDLRSIVVPGGGQGDIWQGLTCRGKYAGEIRVEITYYDTRPKPERPAVRAPQPPPVELDSGSTRQRSPTKRRPLPSDPVTGEAPPQHLSPDYQQTPPPPRHTKTTSQSGYIPQQSPLQSMEYNPPQSMPGHHHQQDDYNPQAPIPTPQQTYPPQHTQRQMDPYEPAQRHFEDYNRGHRGSSPQYDPPEQRRHPQSYPELHDVYSRDETRQLPSIEGERPPPPPAHRSRHNSGGQESSPRSSHESVSQRPSQPLPMRHDVLKSEAQRHSLPSYPGRPTYQEYGTSPPGTNHHHSQSSMDYDDHPRHHSQDAGYGAPHRAMQPTVEDVPDSPTGPMYHPNRSDRGRSPQFDNGYGHASSPAPLNLSRSPGASSYQGSPSPLHAQSPHGSQTGYPAPVSPLHARDFTDSPSQVSHHSHSSQSIHPSQTRESEVTHIQSSTNYGLPSLPPSLVPGIDPNLSRDISDQIYEERRHDRRQPPINAATPPRGRHRSEPPESYGSRPSPQAYTPQPHDPRQGISYSGRPEAAPMPHPSTSPSQGQHPEHKIRRKSVSPAPPPLNGPDRLAGVPFGPDSLDALNPGYGGSSPEKSPSPGEFRDATNSKIISHDGREIDPSDHLPMESWAPEPEPKQKQGAEAAEPRGRPTPGGAQPMPPSGRRAIRASRQTQSPASIQPSPVYSRPEGPQTPPAPSSGGRTRLQKKAPRGSSAVSPSASSPLAPISPDNSQDRQQHPHTPTRGGPPRGGWDYANENRSPHYGGLGGGAPPIPAKVPMMSGANVTPGDHRALAEEMQRIDIGAGRSRRRGGY